MRGRLIRLPTTAQATLLFLCRSRRQPPRWKQSLFPCQVHPSLFQKTQQRTTYQIRPIRNSNRRTLHRQTDNLQTRRKAPSTCHFILQRKRWYPIPSQPSQRPPLITFQNITSPKPMSTYRPLQTNLRPNLYLIRGQFLPLILTKKSARTRRTWRPLQDPRPQEEPSPCSFPRAIQKQNKRLHRNNQCPKTSRFVPTLPLRSRWGQTCRNKTKIQVSPMWERGKLCHDRGSQKKCQRKARVQHFKVIVFYFQPIFLARLTRLA